MMPLLIAVIVVYALLLTAWTAISWKSRASRRKARKDKPVVPLNMAALERLHREADAEYYLPADSRGRRRGEMR